MEVTFQVNNQKFGISKHRFIQSDTHILQEDFEDTKGVIVIRKSKKNRQQNGQKKKNKRTNSDLQNIYIKLKIA